jgi:hypothetical protein
MTSVYAHPVDIGYMEQMCAAVESNGGRVLLVQLLCSQDELDRRVVAEHRIAGTKISDAEQLRALLKREDMSTPLPGRKTLTIENTAVSPEEAAEQIAEHYGLKRVGMPAVSQHPG